MSLEHTDFDPWDPVERFSADADEASVRWTLYEKDSPATHYLMQIGRLLIERTGDKRTYLTAEAEQELAVAIQAGLTAQSKAANLEAKMAEASTPAQRDIDTLEELRQAMEAGREAEKTLIECNLRTATYLARLSMNIRPGTGAAPSEEEGESGEAPMGKAGKRQKKHIITSDYAWAPGDITKLRSPYADYDERVQVVNEALVKAVRSYKPGIVHSKGPNVGKPVRFRAYAMAGLKGALARHVKAYEKPGIYIPVNRVEETLQALADTNNDMNLEPWQIEEYKEWSLYREPLNIEDMVRVGAADEELDDDDETSVLPLAEVIADMDAVSMDQIIMERLRDDAIAMVLKTLSEREAGVIRLRYGLVDGKPRTHEEIGEVYGISRERVRVILKNTLEKLMDNSRSRALRQFLSLDGHIEMPLHTLPRPRVKTGRTVGASAIRLVRDIPMSADNPASEPREGWQVSAVEDWDEPVRKTPEQLVAEYAAIQADFSAALFNAQTYSLQRSFVESGAASDYPHALAEAINKRFENRLTARHIETFWNESLEAFIGHMNRRVDDLSYDRIMQLLSKLMCERMNDATRIELVIPESLQGRLNYIGYGMEHGELIVHGDVGHFAGYKMSGLANITINGSAGDYVGAEAKNYAHIEVMGDAGHYAAARARNNSSIHIYGNAGNYCGYRVGGSTDIQVLESAGEHLAKDATGGHFVVSGSVGSTRAAVNFKGTIDIMVR